MRHSRSKTIVQCFGVLENLGINALVEYSASSSCYDGAVVQSVG